MVYAPRSQDSGGAWTEFKLDKDVKRIAQRPRKARQICQLPLNNTRAQLPDALSNLHRVVESLWKSRRVHSTKHSFCLSAGADDRASGLALGKVVFASLFSGFQVVRGAEIPIL